MAFLNRKEKKRIATAVEAAENKTRGEFVTVIAQAADDYTAPSIMLAALLALILPGPFLLMDIVDPHWLYVAQLICFMALSLLFLLTPLRYHLVPRSIKHRRARRLAREQFMAQGVNRTKERAGLLLFVSVAEHYVEVLADAGINAKVDKTAWQDIVDDFIHHVKTDQVADGFVTAVERCTDILAEHFPGQKHDQNELPDRLVEI
ncbi:MAG TPA: TPM domain-containing protein [Gammaproteobacteria bacterium]|nr:TPM domain-containing protein [Gammaproteobacteria bacterium]